MYNKLYCSSRRAFNPGIIFTSAYKVEQPYFNGKALNLTMFTIGDCSRKGLS